MYKIIFLDIDGVLNSYQLWKDVLWRIASLLGKQEWYRQHSQHPFKAQDKLVKRLAKITKESGAKVVLTASCRGGYWGVSYEKKSANMKALEDLFNKYEIQVIDATSNKFNGHRGKQISDWLVKNKHLWSKYVILDDETFELDWYTRHKLVKIDSKKGITNYNVVEALKILGC